MIRAAGFMQGLRGDLVFSTVAARSFKEQYPDSHLTLTVGPQFKDLLPLFHNHPYYDATHVYSTYDNWPGEKDIKYLQSAKYDIVFHPMPQHRDQWFLHRHQYAEAANMVGLPIPADINPVLTRWFGDQPNFPSKVIAFAPFGGNGGVNDKMFSVKQAQFIVDFLRVNGWQVLHLGSKDEPRLDGALFFNTCYFDSVRNMLSCRALIHCDTGLGHVAGAYNHPSLGFYGYKYFGKDFIHRIQPIHSQFNAEIIENMSDFTEDLLGESIQRFLVKIA
jgi:ADP-heptose:LPS heptosyltransferase